MNYNLLTPSQLPYPGQATTTDASGTIVSGSAGGYQMPARDGLFNSIFTPEDLPYPLPVVAVTPPTTPPTATTPPTTTTGACACCTCPTSGAGSVTLPVTSTGANGASNGTSSTAGGGASSVSTGGTSGAAGSPATTPSSVAPSAPASSSTPSQIIINVGVPAAASPASGASDTGAVTGAQPTGGAANSASGAAPPASPAATTAALVTAQAATPATVAPFAVPQATRTPNLVLVPPVVGASSGAAGGDDTSAPSDVMVQAYSYNPRLRARTARAQDQILEDMLDENLTSRMFSSSATPIAFVVPDGCDSVEFYVGAIEVNPCHGEAHDLESVVTIGEPKVSACASNGQLRSGDQISVVVPWRYASWVELAAEHLRVAVLARFSASEVMQPL